MNPTTNTKAKSKKTATPSTASLEEFNSGVLYALVSLHGMPKLVAQELVVADREFLASRFERGDLSVLEAADELSVKPGTAAGWVQIDEDALVLNFDGEVERLLKQALDTGLFGANRREVVDAMVRRGVEAVLPVLSACTGNRSGRVSNWQ
ncbi:hypothetical protein [Acidovorax sp. sic0104]|uniref:hypothetical protein n=1 Tax=Acidovorax sp. sic0104 TaxID=2854784 RepID=UPI001C43E15E|nr:hypothetical protein [Acidovorax sp. sic0104]MBV7542005.1 hypothetical protein [Acidovorax sp. sic0104]